MKLITAKLVTQPDAYPDLSFLGSFTNKDPDEVLFYNGKAFVHRPNDPLTLNYFISADVDESLEDDIKRARYLDNYETMCAFDRNEWYMMFVQIVIRIQIGDTIQEIKSAGTGGIMSNCDCLGELAEEELDSLALTLKELHFSVKDVLELGLEL